MAVPRLVLGHAAVLVVDVQEKLLPHIHNAQPLVEQIGRLIDGAHALDLPVLVTEQYRKGLGPTVADVAHHLPEDIRPYEKLKFSACIQPVREQLNELNVHSLLICGIEAHVCVLQTCLDLLCSGYLPMVVVDAIGSRRIGDQEMAVQRMVQAGVVPTTVESALLELVDEAGTGRFKAMLPIIK
jgi:nicotinamidase-related amidase